MESRTAEYKGLAAVICETQCRRSKIRTRQTVGTGRFFFQFLRQSVQQSLHLMLVKRRGHLVNLRRSINAL